MIQRIQRNRIMEFLRTGASYERIKDEVGLPVSEIEALDNCRKDGIRLRELVIAKKLDEAYELAMKIIDIDPFNLFINSDLLNILIDNFKYDNSKNLLDKLTTLIPDDVVLKSQKIKVMRKMGLTTEAISYAYEVRLEHPDDAFIADQLVNMLLGKRRDVEATQLAIKFHESHPMDERFQRYYTYFSEIRAVNAERYILVTDLKNRSKTNQNMSELFPRVVDFLSKNAGDNLTRFTCIKLYLNSGYSVEGLCLCLDSFLKPGLTPEQLEKMKELVFKMCPPNKTKIIRNKVIKLGPNSMSK